MCPRCGSRVGYTLKGFYVRRSDGKKFRRFRCRSCKRVFSEQNFSIDYRFRKRSINQAVFFSLCSGISQRRCAAQFAVKPEAIVRRLLRFSLCAKQNLAHYRAMRPKATEIMIDEMESFEHTKCKPITLPIAVEAKTRKILSVRAGSIAAKGHLAKISRAKYGYRKCERQRCLSEVLVELKACIGNQGIIKSDESEHYPKPIAFHLKGFSHQRYKGRRGCVVGQGELKRGGWDPLFSVNHSYAMIRDNVKRLSRRTWCTTKRIDRLEAFVTMYAWFHNLWLDSKKKQPIKLVWLDGYY